MLTDENDNMSDWMFGLLSFKVEVEFVIDHFWRFHKQSKKNVRGHFKFFAFR